MFFLKLKDEHKTTTPPLTTTAVPPKTSISKLKPPASLKSLSGSSSSTTPSPTLAPPSTIQNLMTTSSTSSSTSSCSSAYLVNDFGSLGLTRHHANLNTTKSTNLDEFLNTRQSLKSVKNVRHDLESAEFASLPPELALNQAPKPVKRQFSVNTAASKQPLAVADLVNNINNSLLEENHSSHAGPSVNSKISKLVSRNNSAIPSLSSIKQANNSSSAPNQASKLVKQANLSNNNTNMIASTLNQSNEIVI